MYLKVLRIEFQSKIGTVSSQCRNLKMLSPRNMWSFLVAPPSIMGTPLFVTPLHVGHFQERKRCNSLLQVRACSRKISEQTRARQREQAPVFEQNKAKKLGRDLLAGGILQDNDVKLFETFSDSRAELFIRVLDNRTRHITFVLDGVHGAHNLAAIARSCDAWGVQDLHLIAQSNQLEIAEESKKGRRTTSLIERFQKDKSVQNVSKNSHKWLTIKEHEGVEACLQELKSSGYKILVSSLSPTATPIQAVDVSAKCAFVFGSERDGVSKEMGIQADGLFTIPMMGFVESMNVSVAVGTTASLTISKSQATVPQVEYLLSTDEKRELAHIWLMNRFSSRGSPKTLPSSQDVTRLGLRCERRILRDGMFEQSEDHLFDPRNPRIAAIRLSDDTGARLATYLNRRKFGALGDGRFDKRCGTITYCLAGAHALSCAAALGTYESFQISRSKLFEYFSTVCDRITNLYAPYFDSNGNPILPTFAPESQQTFDKLATQASHQSLPVCLQLAHDLFGLDTSATHAIIESASYQDLSRCVTDTLRLSGDMSEVLQAEVLRGLPKLPDLMHILQQRESVRKLSCSCKGERMLSGQRSKGLSTDQLAVLQIFLRLSHVAYLSSEIHQAVWDRSTTKNHLARVHSLRFGLLESVLCEAWAESVTVPTFKGMGPLRLVVELDQALVSLRLALKSSEVSEANMHLYQDNELRKNDVAETANVG